MTAKTPTRINIKRKRGDTKAIVFIVKNSTTKVVVDISLWTAFFLTVDPVKDPIDANANIFQTTGAFVTDGTDGKVRFYPPGTSVPGSYFYDTQATNNDNKKETIAEGSYKITQDITKD